MTELPDKFKERFEALLPGGEVTLSKFEELVNLLRTETRKGGMTDPEKCAYAPWAAVQGRIGQVADPMTRSLVEEFYLAWWDSMTAYQIENRLPAKTAYRAIAALNISFNRHAAGDMGAALRWACLARLADVLDAGKFEGGAGVFLRTALGLTREVLDQFDERANQARLEADASGWRVPDHYPEGLLTGLLCTDDLHYHLIRRSVLPEYPTARSFAEATIASARSDDSGKGLEWAIGYLATTLPGCRVRVGLLAKDHAFQNDVVVSQFATSDFPIPGIGGSVLVECKNWKERRVNVQAVGFLFARLQLLGSRLGVIVAPQGVTTMGRTELDDDERAGRALITRMFHQTGAACIVIDAGDLLAAARRGFRALLISMYEEFVQGRTSNNS